MYDVLDMPNRIPAEPIIAVVEAYLSATGDRIGDGVQERASVFALAARADIHQNTLEKILNGNTVTIDFDVADRLLCAANMNDLWWTDLRDIYEGARLEEGAKMFQVSSAAGVRRCANRGCVNTFPRQEGARGQGSPLLFGEVQAPGVTTAQARAGRSGASLLEPERRLRQRPRLDGGEHALLRLQEGRNEEETLQNVRLREERNSTKTQARPETGGGRVTVAPEVREAPAWFAEMEFCHLFILGASRLALCGCGDVLGDCHVLYNGEAVCPGCGLPTCPRCAQLAALEDSLA